MSDDEGNVSKDEDEPVGDPSDENLKNFGLRLTRSMSNNENGQLELNPPGCEEDVYKLTDESFLHHTENSKDDFRNLSLRLEIDKEEEPSPVFKIRQIVSTLPTFSDEESSDSDHLTKRTRLKLDKLKKTIEQTEKRGRKSDNSGLDATVSDFPSSKDQLLKKKKGQCPKINTSGSGLRVKRRATPASESDTDSSAFLAVKKRKVARGIKSKQRARTSESSEQEFGNKSATDDTWLRKDDTDVENKRCKRSRTRKKRTFSSGTSGKSENTDHELSSTSASRTQKRRSGLSSEEKKKKLAMQRSMMARKRIDDLCSDSDTENHSPERPTGQRKTRTIASILTERRVSLNVTSNNCDFKRWVSDCKQLEERRRTLAKSLSKSWQSAEDVEKSVIDEVFEEGSYSEFYPGKNNNKNGCQYCL